MQFMLPACSLYLTAMIVFYAMDIYKVLGCVVFYDIVFTLTIIFLGANTFSGLISTAIAGLMITVTLHSLRWLIGYKVLEKTGICKWEWVYYAR